MTQGRPEMYPWSTLTRVGDYFFVTHLQKDYRSLGLIVAQKNHKTKGEYRYSITKTSYGSIVMLAQVEERMAPYDYMSGDGIYGCNKKPPIFVESEEETWKSLSQSQRIAIMPVSEKMIHLPWWYDEQGRIVLNQRRLDVGDTTKYTSEGWPGPNTPYPEKYNIDPLTLHHVEPEEEEVDSGEYVEEDDPEIGEDDDVPQEMLDYINSQKEAT